MDALSIDLGVFDGMVSAHNALARRFSEALSKLEVQIQTISKQHEQAQVQTDAFEEHVKSQSDAQEKRLLQWAQDLEATQTSLQVRLTSEVKRLDDRITSNHERATEFPTLVASAEKRLNVPIAELAAAQSKTVTTIIPQIQSIQSGLELQLQNLKSDLSALRENCDEREHAQDQRAHAQEQRVEQRAKAQEQAAEQRARAQDQRTEQYRAAHVSMQESLSSEIRNVASRVGEVAEIVRASEERRSNQTAATERKFEDVAVHIETLQHETKTHLLPKLKISLESEMQKFSENVAAGQANLEKRIDFLLVDFSKQTSDLSSCQTVLQNKLENIEARAVQLQSLLDKQVTLHSSLSSEVKQLLSSSLGELDTRLRSDMGQLRANIDRAGTDFQEQCRVLTGRFENKQSEVECKLHHDMKESEAKLLALVEASKIDVHRSLHKVETDGLLQLRISDREAAGKICHVQRILEAFKSHLKQIEDRLHGTDIVTCDSAWVSFASNRSPPAISSRPSRPSSARSADYRRPLHTFQSYHSKVQQASQFIGQQLRDMPNQASSSEQRCDARALDSEAQGLGCLLRDLRTEAPTGAAADAMDDAIQLKVMDVLMDGLSAPLGASSLPVGTAMAAARAGHE